MTTHHIPEGLREAVSNTIKSWIDMGFLWLPKIPSSGAEPTESAINASMLAVIAPFLPAQKGRTVAQASIEELLAEVNRLAAASRSVGNTAIGAKLELCAAHLGTEIRKVFAQPTPSAPAEGVNDWANHPTPVCDEFKTTDDATAEGWITLAQTLEKRLRAEQQDFAEYRGKHAARHAVEGKQP